MQFTFRLLNEYEEEFARDTPQRELALRATVVHLQGVFCRFLEPVTPLARECEAFGAAWVGLVRRLFASEGLDALEARRLRSALDPPVWVWQKQLVPLLRPPANATAAAPDNAGLALRFREIACRYRIAALDAECAAHAWALGPRTAREIFDQPLLSAAQMRLLKGRFITKVPPALCLCARARPLRACVPRSCGGRARGLSQNVKNGRRRVTPTPLPRDALEVPPPPPHSSRAPSLRPATVSLTASAGFNGICNRQ